MSRYRPPLLVTRDASSLTAAFLPPSWPWRRSELEVWDLESHAYVSTVRLSKDSEPPFRAIAVSQVRSPLPLLPR